MKNKLFYFAILPALFFQVIGAFLYFILFKDESFSQIIYFATKIMIVGWPLLWFWHVRSKFLPLFGGNLKKSLVAGVVSGLGIVAIVAVAYFLMSGFLSQFAGNFISAAEGLDFLEHYILFSFFLSVIHSFIEEYYWRWFVLNGLLQKFGRATSVIIASLAFASHHLIVVMQFVPLYLALIATFFVFVIGMFWSELYLRTKNIAGSWLSHFFADAIIMTIGYFLIFSS
jgi:uncharacterized protein